MRIRMSVAYNGVSFHGFARNEGVATVAGALGDALARVLGAGDGNEVALTCAGRTDRGVHAAGQVVSFDAPLGRINADDPAAGLARLQRSLNRICGPDIAVRDVAVAPDDFDARFSCTGRIYRYRVLDSPVGDPLAAGFSWHTGAPLSIQAMRLGADRLLGTHDFASFCRRADPEQSLVRTVRRAEWWREGPFAVFEIEARSFCHQMVRSVVALLVAVGSGRRQAVSVGTALAARNRSSVPSPAPPHGLILWKALYNTPPPEPPQNPTNNLPAR